MREPSRLNGAQTTWISGMSAAAELTGAQCVERPTARTRPFFCISSM